MRNFWKFLIYCFCRFGGLALGLLILATLPNTARPGLVVTALLLLIAGVIISIPWGEGVKWGDTSRWQPWN